ncbi:Flavonoid 3' 5'-methyltransferase [Bienertia sinuspersici]
MDLSKIKEVTILNSPAHVEYILETSSYPDEHKHLKEIRDVSMRRWRNTNTPHEYTIEIGVFTSYSLLSTALTLPEDGKVIALDRDKEAYEVGLPFIKKTGVEHKIDFVEGLAMPYLNELLAKGKEGCFDFAFVDADKDNYINYHEPLLKLIKVGGVITFDNTLWFGLVALAEDDEKFNNPILGSIKQYGYDAIKKLNTFLPNDPRIESTLLSIGDGVTLCRRKY